MRYIELQLKYVPKLLAHFVGYLYNFRDFHTTEVFSSRMCSRRNKDNFQVKITGTTEIYTGEKWRRKFCLMKKWYSWLYILVIYIILFSILRGNRICNFWLSRINWRSVFSTDVPLIDDIRTNPKTVDLYVTFLMSFTFFFLLCLSSLFFSWSIA